MCGSAKSLTLRFMPGIIDLSPVLCEQFFKAKPILFSPFLIVEQRTRFEVLSLNPRQFLNVLLEAAMSSGGFGPGPKKETVYSGPSPPQSGNTGYSGAASKPAGETVYGGPSAPGATVYNPAPQNNADVANAAQNEKVGKAANIFYLIAGLSLVNT